MSTNAVDDIHKLLEESVFKLLAKDGRILLKEDADKVLNGYTLILLKDETHKELMDGTLKSLNEGHNILLKDGIRIFLNEDVLQTLNGDDHILLIDDTRILLREDAIKSLNVDGNILLKKSNSMLLKEDAFKSLNGNGNILLKKGTRILLNKNSIKSWNLDGFKLLKDTIRTLLKQDAHKPLNKYPIEPLNNGTLEFLTENGFMLLEEGILKSLDKDDHKLLEEYGFILLKDDILEPWKDDKDKSVEKDENNAGLSKLFIYSNIIDYSFMKDSYKHTKCGSCKVKDSRINFICCNIENIIKSWEEFCSKIKVRNIECNDYFIYWLYGKIKDSKCSHAEIDNFYKELKKFWKCIESDEPCTRKFAHVKDRNTLRIKKELYDFLGYYNIIKNSFSGEKISNQEIYCDYINYGFRLYENMYKDYNALYSGYYDEDIERFKSTFENVNSEMEFLNQKCPRVKVDTVLDKEKNNIKQIKHIVYKDFIGEKLYHINNIIKEVMSLSSLYELYSTLDKLYDHVPSTTPSVKPEETNYINRNINFLKLWNIVNNPLEKLEYPIYKKDKLDSNKWCEYFDYWLLDKLKDNSDPGNIITFLNDTRKFFYNKEKCKLKKYEFHVDQIENKKNLHDFVESYNVIRNKLISENKDNKKKYCNYVKVFFDLYKEMEQEKSGFPGYSDEIHHFKNLFDKNISELNFLNSHCPGKCLRHIFTDNYNKFCISQEEKTYVGKLSQSETCPPKNSFIAHYSKNENVLISEYLGKLDIYNGFDEDDINEYYKKYCTGLKSFECNHNDVCKLCHKLVRNLTHLYDMPQSKKRDDRCHALKHWLHEEIRKIFSVNSNDVSKEPVIHKLKEVVFSINHNYLYGKPCYIDFVGTLDEWKHEKELHDYFQSYDKIKSSIKSYNNNCEKYIDSLSSINKLYEKYIGNCCHYYNSGDFEETCPDYFKCDEKFNPYNIFLILGCKEEDSKNFKRINKPPAVDYFVKTRTHNSFLFASNRTKFDTFYIVTLLFLGLLGIFMIHFIFYKVN